MRDLRTHVQFFSSVFLFGNYLFFSYRNLSSRFGFFSFPLFPITRRALEEASAATRQAPAASTSAAAPTQTFPSRNSILGPECFPEFHVLAEPEPDRPHGKKKRKGGPKQKDTEEEDEDAHIRQLIAQYTAEEGEIGTGPSSSSAPPPAPPSSSSANANVPPPPEDLEEDEALKASWQGEGYEEDSARGASTHYIKFQQRLERQPQQVARYGFKMDLLWPDRELPAVPPCTCCGAARVVELQLIAPLAAALEEANEYLRESEGSGTVLVPDTWDWSTVAVWTCGASCAASSGTRWAVVEEFCAVSKD